MLGVHSARGRSRCTVLLTLAAVGVIVREVHNMTIATQ